MSNEARITCMYNVSASAARNRIHRPWESQVLARVILSKLLALWPGRRNMMTRTRARHHVLYTCALNATECCLWRQISKALGKTGEKGHIRKQG